MGTFPTTLHILQRLLTCDEHIQETLLNPVMPFSNVAINMVEIKPGPISPSDMPPVPILS